MSRSDGPSSPKLTRYQSGSPSPRSRRIDLGDQQAKQRTFSLRALNEERQQEVAAPKRQVQFTTNVDAERATSPVAPEKGVATRVTSPAPGAAPPLEATPSLAGKSVKSENAVSAEVTLAEEHFAYYRGEANFVVGAFVKECNRHWRHAVRDLGLGKASQRFSSNEEIQRANSLTPSETRNILLGHNARVVDPWIGYVKGLKDRALKVVSKCLESAYCPRVQSETNCTVMSVGQEDTESFVDLEEMAYVHVWKSRREGRAFQHALRALAQLRQDVLLPPIVAVPFSVAVAFQGRFITVTWMPPLVHRKPQTLNGGVLAQVEEVWRVAVGVDDDTVRVPFYAGGDGRYYSVTMNILADSNLTLSAESTLHERFEYNCRDDLVEFVRTGQGASNDAHLRNGIDDRLLPALQRKMKDVKTLLNSGGHFVSQLFHCCGVSLQLLLHVRDRFATQVNERKDQLVSLLTIGDFSKAKSFILENIDNEVVARTLKCLILGAIAHATRHYVPYSREDMSEIILRCANSTIQGFLRSAKFIKNILLPAIQKKFLKAPDFIIDMDKLHIVKIMRHLEEKLGLTFDMQEKKFIKADVRPFYIGNSGRKPIPYCPLNDAAVVALEFLTAQKSWRRNQRMVRRMLATLMAVSVSATGINLSIDGCFTIFTESLCDVLARHEREQKKILMGGGMGGSSAGGASTGMQTPQVSQNFGATPTPYSTAGGSVVASAGFAVNENGVVSHLLLIGIMGEIVQSESPAVTASELEYLCRIRVLEFADKMYIAERCHQLFNFFSSPKGMITVRLDDTDTRVKVLSLWGRSIMRGIENVAHQPEMERNQMDPKRMYEHVLGKYPLPTESNLDAFLSLVMSDELMVAISRCPAEVRSDIIRAFVAASISVKNTTSEKCAQVVISFADAVYDDIFEELHPTLADSLCSLHDELPRGSAMAFMIALLVAPTLMHHPGSARLAIDVGGTIRQVKLARRILLPGEVDLFPIVSQGKVLHQVVLNIAEGKERAEDEALYKHVLQDEHQTNTRQRLMYSTPAVEAEKDADEDEDEDADETATDGFSVTTASIVNSRPPGHFLLTRWFGQFMERPECMEMLERYRIELLYQQQTVLVSEELQRVRMEDTREREVFEMMEMRARFTLERELYGKYLAYGEWFMRHLVISFYESRFRCVLHEFHDRTIYRLTRHQEFQHLILKILNVVCQQKIAERIARQEAEARSRREGKYLITLVEVVEESHRTMLGMLEVDARRSRLLPLHSSAMLHEVLSQRVEKQFSWLSTTLEMKHFERSQKIAREGLIGQLELHERISRLELSQRLEQQHATGAESLCRWRLMQEQHGVQGTQLVEQQERLQLYFQESREAKATLHLQWQDIRSFEAQGLLTNLALNVEPWFKEQYKQWLSQWWDIYITMERFCKVQYEESRIRADLLVPMWRQMGAQTLTEQRQKVAELELRQRAVIVNEYFVSVLILSEVKGRDIGIVAAEREQRRLRLQAAGNRISAKYRSECMDALAAEEATCRKQLIAKHAFNNDLLIQFQVIAFSSIEELKKQERRHFAAILAVLGIEEVAGMRHEAEGHRQTTQQKWRLADSEQQVRRVFLDEEQCNRFFYNEMYARLQAYADEEFERQEWWYLFRDTSVLLWREQELASYGSSSTRTPAPMRQMASWIPRPPLSSPITAAIGNSSESLNPSHLRYQSAGTPLSAKGGVSPMFASAGRPAGSGGYNSVQSPIVGGGPSTPTANRSTNALSPRTVPSAGAMRVPIPPSAPNVGSPIHGSSYNSVELRSQDGGVDTSTTTYMTQLLSRFDSGYLESMAKVQRSNSGRLRRPSTGAEASPLTSSANTGSLPNIARGSGTGAL